jgi:maltose O-acetyltransferase
MRSEKQKMLAGEPYLAIDSELTRERRAATLWMVRFNAASAAPERDLYAPLREGLGQVGRGAFVRPDFHCDYGYNIRLGDHAFLNFNRVVLDVAAVEIGAGTQIGPGAQILTAEHPREARSRATGVEFGRPVTIGRNVWIGGGAIILPGVTLGDDCVIGAGSVVTGDIPAGATAYGNPARLARTA